MLSEKRQNILLIALIVAIVIMTAKALSMKQRSYYREISDIEKRVTALEGATENVRVKNSRNLKERDEKIQTLENLFQEARANDDRKIQSFQEQLEAIQRSNDTALRSLQEQLEAIQASNGESLKDLKEQLEATVLIVSKSLVELETKLDTHWHPRGAGKKPLFE